MGSHNLEKDIKKYTDLSFNKINDEFEQVSDKSYVFCAGGYRSVIACSILMKNGKKDLINVLGGYSEISKEINL